MGPKAVKDLILFLIFLSDFQTRVCCITDPIIHHSITPSLHYSPEIDRDLRQYPDLLRSYTPFHPKNNPEDKGDEQKLRYLLPCLGPKRIARISPKR